MLQAEDLAGTATRFCARLGYSEDSQQAKDLLNSCLALWHNVIGPMDGDGDGKVTPEEMAAAFLGQLSLDSDGFEANIRGIATQFFAMCDRDGDGWISQDEWVAVFSFAAVGQQGVLQRHRSGRARQPDVRQLRTHNLRQNEDRSKSCGERPHLGGFLFYAVCAR
ncbi:hypothetical protein [Actinophytocola sp.]|uniref:EF-hand domain-containing protein n=1 Tax=Actinophytocola sp. TaxID=1872138 RepID=UPI002D7ED096|nr:hypothetical protein [Actinophytocola sp.]HET9144366.1 hypothetical protein [Actinophytocola sp.]